MIDELEYNLALVQSGIEMLSGVDGMNNRIREWLATPEGTMIDKPRWGHTLRSYQFEPPTTMLAIDMEMAIVSKIRQDINDITVRGIRLEINDIDLINLVIVHDLGIFKGSMDYQETTSG